MNRCSKPSAARRHRWILGGIASIAVLLILSGPAATILHCKKQSADPGDPWDAVYLVCGARAQNRRIEALLKWMDATDPKPPLILVGNDHQKSLWSGSHQRNLSRAEWAVVKLEEWIEALPQTALAPPSVHIAPGHFFSTDGEMQALGAALRQMPAQKRIAIVTCRFHARRAVQRLQRYAPRDRIIAILPGTPTWEDRAPWIVLAEYLKLLRDALGLSGSTWLSRPQTD